MDKSIHILYIDDNPLDRALVKDALEREHGGFVLTEARSQIEFEKCIQDRVFDLVLTDFNILGYEGLQVLEKVKFVSPDTPVIVVTGTGSEEVAVKALKQGASDYVIKTPGHISRLPKTILSAIENTRVRFEKEKTQAELVKMNRFYATISEINRMIVRTEKQKRLFQKICDIAVKTGGFRFAWFGVFNSDGKTTKQIFSAGFEDNYLSTLTLTNSTSCFEAETLKITSFNTGEYVICNDIEKEVQKKQWQTEALERGYHSFISLPIKIDKNKIGTFNLYSDQSNFFDEKEILLIEEIIDDISFALKLIQAEKKRELNDKKLKKAKLKAEESDFLKSAFIANISHEIRTPMNGILGFTELIADPNLSSSQQNNYINIIRKSSDRMLNTINDIISISKIEVGDISVSYAEMDLNMQLRENYLIFQPEAQQKGLELILNKKNKIDSFILKTDSYLFNTVFSNLLRNAIKFTAAGSIEFGYKVEKSKIEFYVKDSGVGIPETKKEIIFEKFRQAHEGHTRKFDGPGLGLSISRAFIEKLGGKIGVESTEGVGSTFHFTLPCKNEKQNRKEAGSSMLENESVVEVQNLKTLIVEDDDTSVLLLELLAKNFSKEILIAASGSEAVELCKKHTDIDLVLMDIQMSGMNGFEATREIRKFNRKVVIIAQTAYATAKDIERTYEAECNDFIAKPIHKKEFISIINKHFHLNN